jgi:hypothetical protein
MATAQYRKNRVYDLAEKKREEIRNKIEELKAAKEAELEPRILAKMKKGSWRGPVERPAARKAVFNDMSSMELLDFRFKFDVKLDQLYEEGAKFLKLRNLAETTDGEWVTLNQQEAWELFQEE